MEIRILNQSESDAPIPGGITLEVAMGLNDVETLKHEALQALEIESGLPEAARTPAAASGEATYVRDFLETRATNDALEARGIVPVAAPHVSSSAGTVSDEPFTCRVHVIPRPHIGLISLDPVNLSAKRIAKPGYSLQAGRDGSGDVEYLDDEKALRTVLVERLDGDLPESAMRALGDEYARAFELELARIGNDPDNYKAAHQLDDEQYAIMMTRRALADARWNYVLDDVFARAGIAIDDADVLSAFNDDFPGYAEQLLELHELRNDIWKTVEKVRRAKALAWLLENAVR